MQFCKPSYTFENKTGFVACSPRLVYHTDTLQQPVKTGKKAGKMAWQIKTFFHVQQGVFMTTIHFLNSDNNLLFDVYHT
jgi:hypothetical protein